MLLSPEYPSYEDSLFWNWQHSRKAQDGGLCIHKAEVEIVQLSDPISSFIQ